MSRQTLITNPKVLIILLNLSRNNGSWGTRIASETAIPQTTCSRLLKEMSLGKIIPNAEYDPLLNKSVYTFSVSLFSKAYYKFVNFKMGSNKCLEQIITRYLESISNMLERQNKQVYELTITDVFFGLTKIIGHLGIFDENENTPPELEDIARLVSHLFKQGHYRAIDKLTMIEMDIIKKELKNE